MTSAASPGPMRKQSFPPIVDERTRLLVLGSLPGERSLAEARYYAHPRNQFWLLMGFVLDVDLAALEYQRRIDVLQAAGIGLWDVVQSAERRGSLDGSIRDYVPNPLKELVGRLPDLSVIAFNGARSAAIGRKTLAELAAPPLIALPSSSPAHTMPLARKCERWLQLRAYL